MTLFADSRRAVKAAEERGFLTAADAATIAGLYNVAKLIDQRDKRLREHERSVSKALELGIDPPPAPPWDNTLLGSYLKYCESLGLSPNGRKAFNAASPATVTAPDMPEGADQIAAMRRRRRAS